MNHKSTDLGIFKNFAGYLCASHLMLCDWAHYSESRSDFPYIAINRKFEEGLIYLQL